MKSQRITTVIIIHAEGIMNVCTKFHDSPSNSCQDISLTSKNVHLLVVVEEMSRDHQSQQDHKFSR